MTDYRTINLDELSSLPNDVQALVLRIVAHLATLDGDDRSRFLDKLIQEMEAVTAPADEVQP